MPTVKDLSTGRGASDLSLKDDTFVITPSDVTVLPQVTDAIHVAVAGDISYYNRQGNLKVLTGAVVGWHPIRTRRIMATGTTATGIHGMVNKALQ